MADPTLLGLTRLDPAATGAATVRFEASFSQPVTGVDASAFALRTSSLSDAAVTGISALSASDYVVSVSTGTGNGSLALDYGGGRVTGTDGRPVAGGTFGSRVAADTGGRPSDAKAADLNGDGRADLVITVPLSDSIAVLLGQGGGSLGTRTDLPTGHTSFETVIADVNGDGRPDLVVSSDDSSASAPSIGVLTVLLGRGDGSFETPRDVAIASSNINGLALGDVNADGRPDIVTADFAAGQVSVYLGRGDGSFGPRTSFATVSGSSGMVLADFNGDGALDAASANEGLGTAPRSIAVLLGRGDGTLGPVTTIGASGEPFRIATADLNGDGKADLAYTTNSTAGTLTVLLGRGDGTFAAGVAYAVGGNPEGIAVADYDGDDRPDIAVANQGGGVSVLFGRGDGTFEAAVTYDAGSHPTEISAADLNGDGRPDILVPNEEGTTTTVLVNTVPTVAGPTYTINRQITPGGSLLQLGVAGLTNASSTAASGRFETASPGATVVVDRDGAATPAGTATVEADQTYATIVALDEGSNRFTATTGGVDSNTVVTTRVAVSDPTLARTLALLGANFETTYAANPRAVTVATGTDLLVVNASTDSDALNAAAAGGTGAIAASASNATTLLNPTGRSVVVLSETSAFLELQSGRFTALGGDAPTFVADATRNTSDVTITAGSGRSFVLAGGGADLLTGSTAATGHAVLVAGAGADTLRGGSGDDQLFGSGGTLLEGGSGASQGLYGGYSVGARDTLVAGTGQHATLAVGQGSNVLDARGSYGDDTLFSGTGSDVLYGSVSGGTTFALGQGRAVAYGGAGDDQFFVARGAVDDTIDGEGGADRVTFVGYAASDATVTTSPQGITTVLFASTGQTATLAHVAQIAFGTGAGT